MLGALWRELYELKRRLSWQERNGRVAEAKEGGWYRVEIGKTDDGQPFLSDWIQATAQYGFRKQFVPLKVGQYVTVQSPGGVLGPQSRIVPASWNDENNLPDERKKLDATVTNTGDLFIVEKADSYEITLKDAVVDIGKGGEFVRGRHGEGAEAARFAAWSGGAKLRKGTQFLVVTDEQLLVSSPPVVGDDPQPDI